MALTPGARLGVYEVVASIGEGGMGQVFRARDTKLDRDVAIKILPEAFAHDADRLARFQREAKTLASLNHPNIAAIHGLEESGGVTALVMELVEGDDLSQRIARGAIPLDEALPIAKQIAEALEAAHEQGIVHRDLKPANIKVRADGTVKVLDFGLAKAMDPVGVVSSSHSMSPTITSPAMTQAGVLLGTAAYMAPEQARGQAIDKRADVWAFGCVLFEMLSGSPAFTGATVSDMLASVLRSEPEWSRLPAATPMFLSTLLRRCLTRDSRHRLRDIGDARLELEDRHDARQHESPTVMVRSSFRLLWWGLGALGLIAASLLILTRRGPTIANEPMIQLDAQLGIDGSIVSDTGPAAVLSPDGSLLAFVARKAGQVRQLFIRRLNGLEPAVLSGTEDARDPFFSPDGQWVAFFANGKLKKVPVVGGNVVTLCDAANGRGGAWGEDGDIVFNPSSAGGSSLQRVSAAGGAPEPLMSLAAGEVTQRWPQLLPGRRAVLYTTSKNLGNYNDGEIVVQPLPDGPRTTLVRGGFFGRYVASGHLIYVHDGRLFAVAMDTNRLELKGSPVPVLERIAAAPTTGGAQIAFSNTGTSVYLTDTGQAESISWLNRDGSSAPLWASRADWSNAHFSPDGQRLAFDVYDGKQTDIWVYEWAGGTLRRLTFNAAEDWAPLWTRDGQRIAFRSSRDLAFNLYWQRADGTGSVDRLTTSGNPQWPSSWHPSGRVLAFIETNPVTANDIMTVTLEDDGKSGWRAGAITAFLKTPAAEGGATFSPDGKWIAYTSNESGRTGVYVRPFPGPGGEWLVSADGIYPTWSAVRPELLFLSSDQQLMVSAYSTVGESFRADTPRPWSTVPLARRTRGIAGLVDGRGFDLHPDGRRIAAATIAQSAVMQNRVVFLFNFFDELRRLVSSRE